MTSTVAVVLAAGLGRRLGTGGPKWLAPVGASCPAQLQLEALELAGVDDVVVVVGPAPAEIAAVVEPWAGRLRTRLVTNPEHAIRNNWWSLVVGADAVPTDADVVVLNSDLFAAPAWLAEAIQRTRGMTDDTGAALAIDAIRPLTDEAMKVSLDGAGRIGRIGKVGVAAPVGEYVGLAWWSAPARQELVEILRGFADDPARADNWYEHGIDLHIAAGGAYRMAPVPSTDWVEIDDPVDLRVAEALADRLLR